MNKHVNKNKPVKVRADYGTTPVLVVDSSKALEKPRPVGIIERIKTAPTVEAVEELVRNVLPTFKLVSEKTIRRCDRAAIARIKFLEAQ